MNYCTFKEIFRRYYFIKHMHWKLTFLFGNPFNNLRIISQCDFITLNKSPSAKYLSRVIFIAIMALQDQENSSHCDYYVAAGWLGWQLYTFSQHMVADWWCLIVSTTINHTPHNNNQPQDARVSIWRWRNYWLFHFIRTSIHPSDIRSHPSKRKPWCMRVKEWFQTIKFLCSRGKSI